MYRHWIIRFEGTITQGPNAGKSYTWANSWGGVQFDSLAGAQAALANYRELEPRLHMRIVQRDYAAAGRSAKWLESVAFDCPPPAPGLCRVPTLAEQEAMAREFPANVCRVD